MITAREFKRYIELDPCWADTLTEDLIISESCVVKNSKIKRLSPHLIFKGRDSENHAALFINCTNLENAAGVFHGGVVFEVCGIRTIDHLVVARPDSCGLAVDFAYCKKLKIATGTYNGAVCYRNCGIENIKSLVITKPDKTGLAASFLACLALKVATGAYPGKVMFQSCGIEKIEDIVVGRADKHGGAATFAFCKKLKVATGIYPGWVDFRLSGIERIENLQVTPSTTGPMAGVIANFQHCNKLRRLGPFWNQNIVASPKLIEKGRVAAAIRTALAQPDEPEL